MSGSFLSQHVNIAHGLVNGAGAFPARWKQHHGSGGHFDDVSAFMSVSSTARNEMAQFIARNFQRPGAFGALPQAHFRLAVGAFVQQHTVILRVSGNGIGLMSPILQRASKSSRPFKVRCRTVELRRHQAIFRRVRPSMILAAFVGPCSARMVFEVFCSFAFIFLSVNIAMILAASS